MKSRVIIGANYGDESKGSVVAYYTKHSNGKVLNVLTNGGAQRAHSVLTDFGDFTFQHFGSGTAFGADNYYSSHFILNPMQFCKEREGLIAKGITPVAYRHSLCRWSTPWDMMANQILEEARGKNKKGSCGMGIWETTLRLTKNINITLDSFLNLDDEHKHLYFNNIRSYYEHRRFSFDIPRTWEALWRDKNIEEHFINDCKYLKDNVPILDKLSNNLPYEEAIFENGQGLLLNDDGTDNPNTTPSKTGLDIPLELIKQLGIDDVTVHYVTRPYLTRHGHDSTFIETNKAEISSYIREDRTNHFNKFQDNFKFGDLSIDALSNRINSDFLKADGLGFKKAIELTHCDEMDRLSDFKKFFDDIHTSDSALVR